MPYTNYKLYCGRNLTSGTYTYSSIPTWNMSGKGPYTYTSSDISIDESSSWYGPTVTSFDITGATGITNKTCAMSPTTFAPTTRTLVFSFVSQTRLNVLVLIGITVTATISYSKYVGEYYNRIYSGKSERILDTTVSGNVNFTTTSTSTIKVYTGTIAIPSDILQYKDSFSLSDIVITGHTSATERPVCNVNGNNLQFAFRTVSGTYNNILCSVKITYEEPVGASLVVKSDTYIEVDYDALANSYIDTLSNLSIALSGNNLNVTFTPVTDTELLDAVDNGDTYVRLQLLNHQPSQCVWKTHTPHVVHSKNSPIWIEDDIESSYSYLNNDFAYVRRKSHDSNTYGITWLNLSKSQLQSGSATLQNVTDEIAPNCASLPPDTPRYYNIRVEMFCPALYRKGKDVFYYERNGHRKISSNRVQFEL